MKLLYLAIQNAGVRWRRPLNGPPPWASLPFSVRRSFSRVSALTRETKDTGQANTKNLTYPAPGINPVLILLPLRPPARHVGAVLLGGVQAFF